MAEHTTQDDLFEGLTEPQQDAVRHVDGPLLVLAGPGSGKTTVVTRRIAHLVAQGIPAWQILALTFTNKAAGEMRERIDRMLPDDLPGRRGLTVSTFHSFCARLLRRYAPEAGLSERYTIYDAADQRDAIKRAMKEASLSTKNWTPSSIASQISHAKNRLLDAKGYAAEAFDFYTRTVSKAYGAYEAILWQNDALDFDDLLLHMARLLRESAAIRTELQERFQYILIDEYQDTNHAQFVIAHALASAPGRRANICVVGDPDQSIYGWRGADIRNILEFEAQYPDTRIIPLGRNFRSTAHIVDTAAGLIRHNRQRKDKRLHTDLGDGEKPTVVSCRDEHHEARLILDEFRRRHEEQGIPWKDMAVLYRINALSRVLEEAFRDGHVPYVIARGTAFYERKEIKDALSYLRLVANPNDEIALRRVVNTPPRGIGNTTLNKVEVFAINRQLPLFEALRIADEVPGLAARAVKAVRAFVAMVDSWRSMDGTAAAPGEQHVMASGESPLAQLTERVIRESGLERLYAKSRTEEDIDRLENLEELISAAADFAPPVRTDGDGSPALLDLVSAYLESVALVSDADMVDPANGAVTLMTLHAAKGLEFDAVAIAGLEEGLLPHSRAQLSDDELEEERRLCFVGITRAKRHLLLSRAAVRTHRGLRERTIPSQFLRELPEASIEVSDQGGLDLEDEFYQPYDDPYGIDSVGGLEAGCLVQHPTFGRGRIEAIVRRPAGASARVSFESVGLKTLILEYAKLQRVD